MEKVKIAHLLGKASTIATMLSEVSLLQVNVDVSAVSDTDAS